MDIGYYSEDINKIDEVISSHIASQADSKTFDQLRKEFLRGFEIGWKFIRAENEEILGKIKSEKVLAMIKPKITDEPYYCGMAIGIIVSSLRNVPTYIFAVPEAIKVYFQFFELIENTKPEFVKYLQGITKELQRKINSTSKAWHERQKTAYTKFLSNLSNIVS